MDEDRIERLVEAKQDILDRRYLNSSMTKEEYAVECRNLELWADEQLKRRG